MKNGGGARAYGSFDDLVLNRPSEDSLTRSNGGVLIGSTVHVVPVEGSFWQVGDPHRHVFTLPSRAAAVAAASQPSQVVLFEEFGRLVPIAQYQLPQYLAPHFENQAPGSLFEAAAKALVIGCPMAAGVAVLGDHVERVDRNSKKKRRSRRAPRRRKRRSSGTELRRHLRRQCARRPHGRPFRRLHQLSLRPIL